MMADACLYCDQIDNTASKLKQDMRSQLAHKNLMTREPTIMKKIDNGESLTDNELDTLWKEENRSDAIDVMYAKDKNLVDDIANRAIKSGDETKITKVGDEIKDEAEICVRKGLCGSEVGLAIGLGAIATVESLSMADGEVWDYVPKTESYRQLISLSTGGNDEKITIPKIIADAAYALQETGIPDLKYTEGEKPGIQGLSNDRYEQLCGDYAIQASNELNKQGFTTHTVRLEMKDNNGKVHGHMMIAVEDPGENYVYHIIDPLQNTTPMNIFETLDKQLKPEKYKPIITKPRTYLIEPQTGKIEKTITDDLIGKRIWDGNMLITKAEIYTGQVTREEALPTIKNKQETIMYDKDFKNATEETWIGKYGRVIQ